MTIRGSIARERANGKGRDLSGIEPDTQALEDERRLVAQPMTRDLSGMDPGVLANAIATGLGGETIKLACGCKPGIGVCFGQRDLAERIRRGKRRATVRGDRGPLREAEEELRAHLAEQGWGS